MTNVKSFIDVLFILLLSTIVLLAQSFQVGVLDTAPAEVGASGVGPVPADRVRAVVVMEDHLILDGQPWQTTDELAGQIQPGEWALLIAGKPELRHHRVMAVWSALQERGLTAKLGVKPVEAEPDQAAREDQ